MILGMQNSAMMGDDEVGNRCHYTLPGQQPRTTEKQNRSLHSSNTSSGAIGDYRIPARWHELCGIFINYNCVNSPLRWAMNRSSCALFLGICLLSVCALA